MKTPRLRKKTLISFLNWQEIITWGQNHYRDRAFKQNEPIPIRAGLLYLVQCGAVSLTGNIRANILSQKNNPEEAKETFLGLMGTGYPFEITKNPHFTFKASAQVDSTVVLWMYWHDLDNWPNFRLEVLDFFRDRHQRQLLWLTVLGQQRTIDRLWGFLTLLIEEYGNAVDKRICFPYPLTHLQISSAIGSTRVTVTRLMGKLRQQGLISVETDSTICLLDRIPSHYDFL
ncbi:Crp/Fnr family transcriptional regulator [Spirulina sp. 06S082]|uniref:Crp/Fnr family transcriptional regulator n=1 Tax=Spirulina sp. 06S082 TaxID=3110248 RepID=UPI002B20A428|nr:Crp/Fnr family transcriptional regulator [Spirulina sp. 06S082]MEA5471483.1 Crp/Fnr family transcriptional regulator [Spirulina sp. 06S082]